MRWRIKPGNPKTVIAATDGGLYKSTNGGDTWTDLNGGLETFQFYTVGQDLLNSGTVFGGTQDNGTVKYSGCPRGDRARRRRRLLHRRLHEFQHGLRGECSAART